MTDASRDKSHPDFSSISRPAVSTPEDHKEWTTKGERMDREALERRFVREREETRRELRGMGSGNDFSGGSSKYVNAMLTLLSGLMLTGIVGGIAMYGHVSALAEKVDATNAKVDLIITGRIK